MFGKNLFVYKSKTKKWDPRTPYGVGWFPHLYSMFDDSGEKTDSFEKFLGKYIETPLAPIMRKAATTPDALTNQDRESIAMFIGVTTARIPSMMKGILCDYISKLPTDNASELDKVVQSWCDVTGQVYTEKSKEEFLKPSVFGAILIWADSLRDRLVKWNWASIRTTRDNPFITSDSPALLQKTGGIRDIRWVTFPISSEIAIRISNAELRNNRNDIDDVADMNRRTLENAKEFVICHKKSFPGDDFLLQWPTKEI
jgi:hypothetical protein